VEEGAEGEAYIPRPQKVGVGGEKGRVDSRHLCFLEVYTVEGEGKEEA
jgi:hypothetical protein